MRDRLTTSTIPIYLPVLAGTLPLNQARVVFLLIRYIIPVAAGMDRRIAIAGLDQLANPIDSLG